MKKLLHIIATPRKEASTTLQVSSVFLKELHLKNPSIQVDTLDLFQDNLPELTTKGIQGKYELINGKDLSPATQQAWEQILKNIERFASADFYLLSVPMWNFSIPYKLKHYIDVILQPRYLFEYTPQGPRGLLQNKKMIVIASRGGDYQSELSKHLDFQEPYLKSVFALTGINDIHFIHAQPMDAQGAEVRSQKIQQAQQKAISLVDTIFS